MTTNREPSNQSFEVDREATVCFAAVASFCDDRYPARHGQRANRLPGFIKRNRSIASSAIFSAIA